MRPKFDPELRLEPGGRTLMACGPINWAADDESATFSAELEQDQDGRIVRARGGPGGRVVKQRSNRPREWMVRVRVTTAGDRLEAGPVVAKGVAQVRKRNQEPAPFPWEHPPEAPDVRLID